MKNGKNSAVGYGNGRPEVNHPEHHKRTKLPIGN